MCLKLLGASLDGVAQLLPGIQTVDSTNRHPCYRESIAPWGLQNMWMH